MDRRRPQLVLLTESFPFRGPDDPFLPHEVEVLSRYFDICFVPTGPLTSRDRRSLSASQSVDVTLAHASKGAKGAGAMVQSIFAGGVSRELRDHSMRSPTARAIVARRWARVRAGRRWAQKQFLPALQDRSTLVYSWWSVPEAFGIAEQLRSTGVPMVTRIHGYDLYGEQDRLGFIPFQRQLIESLARAFSASRAGERYLQSRYPDLADKLSIAYLGVDPPPTTSIPSTDGIFRIVSCSSLVPVKRIRLLIEALHILEERGVKFEWTHLGDGPERASLQAQAAVLAGRARFLGQVPPEEVQAFLTRNPADVFCNVSSSEGLPVTLMEAASCGIPLFATDVGGNNEIVDDSVGRLIPHSCGPELIADVLADMAEQSDLTKRQWRRRSLERWESTFNAESNYEAFAGDLLNLLMENRDLNRQSTRLDSRRETT